MKMNYRPEIDGLRAVAILPVIFFHSGIGIFSGGYIGVDIFFVISGYLITSILINDIENKNYSIANFYERRIRRIFPALTIVLLTTYFISMYVLTPTEFKSFEKSFISSLFFYSNINFWLESGYFDTASELKPLLHTWSLAIEEQFYIFFPPLLFYIYKNYNKSVAFVVFFIIAIFSLLLSVYFVASSPSATFYLLPTRGWELLAGSLIAFKYTEIKNVNGYFKNLFSILGLMFIVFPIFYFDSKTVFPAQNAIFPVLGTSLILIFCDGGSIVGKILTFRPLVFLGLISYSLYLWHQPILAFNRHINFGGPSPIMLYVLLISIFVISCLTWRYIENPIRNKSKYNRKFIFTRYIFITSSMFFLAIIILYTKYQEHSWKQLQTTEQVATFELFNVEQPQNPRDNSDCIFNTWVLNEMYKNRILTCFEKYGPGLAVIGDSHAVNTFDIFQKVYTGYNFVIGVTKGGCTVDNVSCPYAQFLNFTLSNPRVFEFVVYEEAAFRYFESKNYADARHLLQSMPPDSSIEDISIDIEAINNTYEYLVKLSKSVKVVFSGPKIEHHLPINYIVDRGCEFDFELRTGQLELYNKLDYYLSNIYFTSPNIFYISQIKMMDFDATKDIINCENSFWRDGDHLSEEGFVHFYSQTVTDKGKADWLLFSK